MKLFAIGDLHLSGAVDKPMGIFGPCWDDHFTRISQAWNQVVAAEDIVLIPGDISWAMHLEEARVDLEAISQLPGRKILIRGNHDYWWSSVSRVRNILPEGMYVLQNSFLELDGYVIAGTRGWSCPGSVGFTKQDEKIYHRELIRLQLALANLPAQGHRIAMLHFPPFYEKQPDEGFVSLLERFAVETVVYGHLHAKSCKNAFEGKFHSVDYHLVSADHIGFRPKLILESAE